MRTGEMLPTVTLNDERGVVTIEPLGNGRKMAGGPLAPVI